MTVGLRIDVDTFRGTKLGVPALLRSLDRRQIRATFFFCVGPDNMGRHLWRLIRPTFLWKMLRTRAAGLYGWDILFKGTFWPGPQIGSKLAGVIRDAERAGHEIGLHAWDHHAWQAKMDSMSAAQIEDAVRQGFDSLAGIIGREPDGSASPGWKTNDAVLRAKSRFPFRYNSDCRGTSVFRPQVEGTVLSQPQVPVTLPTYDEIVGPGGVSAEDYNSHMLSLLRRDQLNVLTVHAEVEGILCNAMFDDFLSRARADGWTFDSLGALVPPIEKIPASAVVKKVIPGREGWVGCQEAAAS